MRDGRTRIIKRETEGRGFDEFRRRFKARVVLLSGPAGGSNFELDLERVTLGRGPGVGVAFENPLMSRQHAAIDYTDEGFRITDLDSTNGLSVNGNECRVSELRHGDCFEIGGQRFQLAIDELEDEPDTYELPAED
jgi:pSer/pThr/pTyr-binding forkhead associated (FHA) protein